ncbi:MAG: hypothetical protein KDK45_09745, partial [Leptospiraceae bacterium]|nr:hypothetical protein [Leptospiraceae bacterium]
KYIYPIKVQKTPDASFIIQFKDFPISTISLLEAGKKIKTLSFEKTTDPYSYKVFSELSNSGSILLINQNFFSCLKKKEENLSDVLEFILDRYYLKSYMSDRKLEKANCYDVN